MRFHLTRWGWLLALSTTLACGESGTADNPLAGGGADAAGSGSGGTGGGTFDGGSTDGAAGQGGIAGSGGQSGAGGAGGAGGVAGSAGAGPDDAAAPLACDNVLKAIVTDIDATLTESDNQWIAQLAGGAEPVMRAGASDLITGYADRGYYIVYLTARPENTTVPALFGSETAREATDRWLNENNFPRPPRSVLLLSPSTTFGQATQDYKTGELQSMESQGYEFMYAYGNADTDIGAYETAGIDKAETFIIGSLAGTGNTQPISGNDFVSHAASQLPTVPAVCDPNL